jgi:glycosyltransferase involved in cell wall biosynthesis
VSTRGTRPGVALVIPAYNEQARLPRLFEVLQTSAEADLARAGLDYVEAVIVDDGSTDDTRRMIEAAAARDPRVRPVVEIRRNSGKGAAIKAGVGAARAEMVLLVDVDLSTPLTDAWKLSARLAETGAAIAIGSRDREGADVVAPLHRKLLGSAFNLAVRALTGLRFTDTQSGFKLLETATARSLMDGQVSAGFAFDVELLARARLAGLEVAEVPVSYVHDHGSKVRVLRTSAEMARDLIRVSLLIRRDGRRARRTPPLEDAGRG